jgi:hypothetical protein
MTDLVMPPRVCLSNRHSRDATAEAGCTGSVYRFVFMCNSGVIPSLPRRDLAGWPLAGPPRFFALLLCTGAQKTERTGCQGWKRRRFRRIGGCIAAGDERGR